MILKTIKKINIKILIKRLFIILITLLTLILKKSKKS